MYILVGKEKRKKRKKKKTADESLKRDAFDGRGFFLIENSCFKGGDWAAGVFFLGLSK